MVRTTKTGLSAAILLAGASAPTHASTVLADGNVEVRTTNDTATGRIPLVAVLDTGVVPTPRLAPMLVASYDMHRPDAPRSRIVDPHGTEVAGVIAAYARTPIRIVSMRIDTGNCGGTVCEVSPKAIATALRKAVELRVDVVQLSSYGRFDRDAVNAFREAASAGIRIVIAAGNQGGAALPVLVALKAGPGVHVVGSLDPDGRRSDYSARSYSRRFELDWRLGIDVHTEDGEGRPVTVSGTSFAAPILTAELLDEASRTSTGSVRIASMAL